jgi:hypothetical protein
VKVGAIALLRKLTKATDKRGDGSEKSGALPTDLRDAHFQKQDIFSFNARAKAALAYDKLIRELFVPEPESIDVSAMTYEKAA